ncbi:MAG: phenylpropionate dioxygenase-like ring-hydroxylating dioxygenase large terminal subunit [Parasphingorhabdus sp.]|jgi:phenylpropionate dioxygenase-like ring-hydroxylating dioxygenase large terminal subunit
MNAKVSEIDNLSALLENEHLHTNSTLGQPFYCSNELLQVDLSKVFSRHWILAGHISRLPRDGQYFLFQAGQESLVVVRENATTVNAFYNVCRHRGSRICLEDEGEVRNFVCPYHSWRYNLDGSLKFARSMPEDFDPADNGLIKCQVKLWHGLIFLHLGNAEDAPFEKIYAGFNPYVEQQGIAEAKTAARVNYPTAANWKLVVENFIECYHCNAAHPEYVSVHSKDKLLAFGAGQGSGPEDAVKRYQKVQAAWETKARSMGHFCGLLQPDESEFGIQQAGRFPINDDNWMSETLDGKAACSRLMGAFKDYDGGQTAMSFNPFSYLLASNDYAIIFRFTPIEATHTDVEITWLVHPEAEEGVDYDLDHMMYVWDITTRQDKTITENNQAGVLSKAYRPGRYSELEVRNKTFKQWYLNQLSAD